MRLPAPTPGWLPLKRRAVELAQPLSVQLELTYACNWRCVFCYNPRHHDQQHLRASEWEVVLDDLRSLGSLYVALTGGECLTHPDFLAIARAVRVRSMALRVLTNAALVNDEMADHLAGLLASVEVSIHGARPQTHDRATSRPGSFEAMLAGLDRLRARNVPLLLKTPLTRQNEDEVEGMVALADERRLPYRIDATLTPRDDGDRGPLQYAATPAGIERAMRISAARGQLPYSYRDRGGINCGSGRVTLTVDPEGNVYPCMQWRKSSLGNVREVPLRELWQTSAVRQEAAGVARAANERMLDLGGPLADFPFCPALAFQRTGDALVPDESHLVVARMAQQIRGESA
jgi:MoaA/NifB/PqqE/SkfB family radical SAM enzyme